MSRKNVEEEDSVVSAEIFSVVYLVYVLVSFDQIDT